MIKFYVQKEGGGLDGFIFLGLENQIISGFHDSGIKEYGIGFKQFKAESVVQLDVVENHPLNKSAYKSFPKQDNV